MYEYHFPYLYNKLNWSFVVFFNYYISLFQLSVGGELTTQPYKQYLYSPNYYGADGYFDYQECSWIIRVWNS